MSQKKFGMTRRSFFTKSTAATAAVAAGSLVTNADLEAISGNVNTNSQPSQLKITDMRVVCLGNWNTKQYIVRLDTNQGISGYGDIRDRASKTYGLMLKSRILGMNPCNVDQIFRKIKQHGSHGVQGGGISAIEVACWDLAGKAWGVPVWQMLGGKFRDRVTIYGDTPGDKDPVIMAENLKAHVEKYGFHYVKMDVGIGRLQGIEGTTTEPAHRKRSRWMGVPMGERIKRVPHPFTGIQITEKGLKLLEEYCATVRDIVGWDLCIATDHYGDMGVENQIKLARALDKFNFAWYEDMVPWWYTDDLVRIKNSCTTPLCTGEDIYCHEGFKDLFEKKAIGVAHPDLAQFGGILESKKTADLAAEYGVSFAFHNANSPVTMMASVHAAAAMEHFTAVEHHQLGFNPEYDDLLDGISKPIVQHGDIQVPDGPGLGFELNEEAVKKQLKEPGYFEPTPEWDDEVSHDTQFTFSKPTKNTLAKA